MILCRIAARIGKGLITRQLTAGCGPIFLKICSGGAEGRGVSVFPIWAGLDSQRGEPPNRERRKGWPMWDLASRSSLASVLGRILYIVYSWWRTQMYRQTAIKFPMQSANISRVVLARMSSFRFLGLSRGKSFRARFLLFIHTSIMKFISSVLEIIGTLIA